MAYSYDATTSIDPFSLENLSFGFVRGGSMLSKSFALNGEKGELVKASTQPSKKRVSEEKALAALKNHSEAERRRRERINSHLSTLRDLVPCPIKTSEGIEEEGCRSQQWSFRSIGHRRSQRRTLWGGSKRAYDLKATICCEYQPELLCDLKQALDSLHLKLVKSEISTLGNRVKSIFFFTSSIAENAAHTEASRLLASSVHRAISLVLEKASSVEYSPRTTTTTLPRKRRRLSSFHTSRQPIV
ncbi:putative transcription factor bHLH-like protein, partial [Cucurbita argyrosperma subsp. argyrosperma]